MRGAKQKYFLEGQKFGRLTVIKQDGRLGSEKHSRIAWLCECECGASVRVIARSLTMGKTVSCGCFHKERQRELKTGNTYSRIEEGEAGFNMVFKLYREHAKERGYGFNLNRDEVRHITSQDCFYCGAKPSNRSAPRDSAWAEYIYNGIDRLDNTKGYESTNVVTACKHCNRAKSDRPVEEFFDWVRRLAARLNREA